MVLVPVLVRLSVGDAVGVINASTVFQFTDPGADFQHGIAQLIATDYQLPGAQ